MRGSAHVACLLLAAAPLISAPPAEDPVVELPSGPVVRPPAPPADAPIRLAAGELYVIGCRAECIPRDHPKGIIKLSRKKGPRDISGKFYGGLGVMEDRTFEKPFLIQVEAFAPGTASLDIIPVGVKSEAQITSIVFESLGGPVPPDVIPPKPKPDPTPKPVPLEDVAWAVVVEESDSRNATTARVLNDTLYWKGLEAKGIKYRFYDKDSPDIKGKNFDGYPAPAGSPTPRILYKDTLGLPYILILDSRAYKLKAAKLPTSTAGIDALLKGESP